jgi:hypothetical protein
MAITCRFEYDGEILIVIASGQDESVENTLNYSKIVLDKIHELQCKKVLSDERKLKYSLSVFDTYQLAEKASDMVRGLGKVAIVCSKNDIGDGKFFETVAVNRGMRVLVTSEYQEALDWLKS